MEVIQLLLFALHLVDTRQRRIATRLIEVQTALLRRLLPQHPQPLPKKALLLSFAVDIRLLGHPPPEAVVAILTRTLQLALDQRLRPDQAVFAVIGKALQLAVPRALLDQIAPGIIAVFLITPLPDAVVLDLVELAGIEVQSVRRGVVAEFLTTHQRTGIAAM
ncbi:hypothetical protein D3C77_522210 [compost metagenome]